MYSTSTYTYVQYTVVCMDCIVLTCQPMEKTTWLEGSEKAWLCFLPDWREWCQLSIPKCLAFSGQLMDLHFLWIMLYLLLYFFQGSVKKRMLSTYSTISVYIDTVRKCVLGWVVICQNLLKFQCFLYFFIYSPLRPRV